MFAWLLITCGIAAVLLSYWFGKNEGMRIANQSAVRAGAWVEFIKVVKCRGNELGSEFSVQIGVQGVVFSVDKWNRFSVWIAEPWVKGLGIDRIAHAVEDYTAVRAIPLLHVRDDIRLPTLESFEKYDSEMRTFTDKLIPREFFEIQK